MVGSKKEREGGGGGRISPLLFISFFTLHRSPLFERLEQASAWILDETHWFPSKERPKNESIVNSCENVGI